MTLKFMEEDIVLLGNTEAALQELDKLFTALAPFMKLLQKQKNKE